MRTGMLEKLCRESGSPCHSFSVLVKAINHWTLDNSHAEDRSRLADKAVIFMSRLPPAQVIGMLLLLAGSISAYLPALVGAARVHRWSFLAPAPVAVPLASPRFDSLYENLTCGNRPETRTAFARVVENRNGVISVTQEAAVFGGGVYDGYFRIDPSHDSNLIIRGLVLSASHV